MFWLIKKMFLVLLTGLVNGSNHTKCVSLSNQKCKTQPTLINYILINTVKNYIAIDFRLDRCVGSFNTLK